VEVDEPPIRRSQAVVVGGTTRRRAREVRDPLLLVSANAADRPSDAPRHPRPLREGCRCATCREAKSRRNAPYREQHGDEISAKQRARPRKPRMPRTASGIVGVYYMPEVSKARPWRAQVGANQRVIHLGMFATKAEAAAARAAAERGLREA